jgi:hypothetical protein
MTDEASETWTDEDDIDAEEHEDDIDGFDDVASGDKSLESPTRIAEDLAGRIGNWSGVNSCCNSDIAIGQLKPHFKKWVAATVATHPGSILVASGWYKARIKCKTKRRWDGKRKCKGWFTKVVCYVDIA